MRNIEQTCFPVPFAEATRWLFEPFRYGASSATLDCCWALLTFRGHDHHAQRVAAKLVLGDYARTIGRRSLLVCAEEDDEEVEGLIEHLDIELALRFRAVRYIFLRLDGAAQSKVRAIMPMRAARDPRPLWSQLDV